MSARPLRGEAETLAIRLGFAVAAIGLLWTLLLGALGLSLWGAVVLASRLMPLGLAALVVGGLAATLAATFLFLRRRPPRRSVSLAVGRQLVEDHPLESVLAAAALGLVVSRTDDAAGLLMRAVAQLSRDR